MEGQTREYIGKLGLITPLVPELTFVKNSFKKFMLDLSGKRAFVTGIANNRSIAWGIAQQLHQAGAEIGVSYLPDEKGRFEKKVRELTEPLNPSLVLPGDVQD
ncbi:MAG: enoyl-[acyl-carrier-protein] reductase, partial [Cyanobacteriota bacterium]